MPASLLDGGVDAQVVVAVRADAAQLARDATAPVRWEDAGEQPPVLIRFRASFGDMPWVCGQRVPNQGSDRVEVLPRDLRVFITNLRLLSDDGTETLVELIDRPRWQAFGAGLLDFAPDCSRGTAASGTSNFALVGRVPPGVYTGIAFQNGVPDAVGRLGPEQLPEPFDAVDLHWEWLRAIRFLSLELSTARGSPISLLVTNTGCPGVALACTRPNRNEVRLTPFDPARDTIVFDVTALLQTTALGFGFDCHAEGEECAFAYAELGIDWASGQPLAEQRVYRVVR